MPTTAALALARRYTFALPKAGELTTRQKVRGIVSMLAMTAFSWWLAQPVHQAAAAPAYRLVPSVNLRYGHIVHGVMVHYMTG